MNKIYLALSISLILILFSSFIFIQNTDTAEKKQVICVVGGTPSTKSIINQIPDKIKEKYDLISFNRPGFGETPNSKMSKQKLFELAKKAGLKKHDFGIIGISGGAPLAILIADEFNLAHCGIISGMVSKEAYFKYADSTFTKPLMSSVLIGFDDFKTKVEAFPNVNEILKEAGSSKERAIRGSFDELSFILSSDLFTEKDYKDVNITWWHGENDKNVALQSVELFLKKFKKADLNIIPNKSHAIDANVYIEKLIKNWEISLDSLKSNHKN